MTRGQTPRARLARSWCWPLLFALTLLSACGDSGAPIAASPVDVIPNAPVDPNNPTALQGRSELSFDAGWKFHLGEAAGAEAPAFNDSAWRSLDLPHDWQIEDLSPMGSDDGAATAVPDGVFYITHPEVLRLAPRQIGPFDGSQSDMAPLFGGRATGWTLLGRTGWYRKSFDVSALPADRHIELRFDGIYQQAEIWLNGVLIGSNEMGYIPIHLDLTPHLKRTGTNVVAVKVFAAEQSSRYYTGSGIYRHTWLTITGGTRIPTDSVAISTPVITASTATAKIKTQVTKLSAGAGNAAVRLTVLNPMGTRVAGTTLPAAALPADNQPVDFAADLTVANPALWGPDTPALYTAVVEVLQGDVVVDTTRTKFGIRSIALDPDKGFLLNGKPFKFRGANVHHDHGPLGAVSLYRSEERRLQLLKAAGFNSYRTAHIPHAREVLEICDRLGILVYDEFLDAWDVPKGGPNNYPSFATLWPRDLTTWIRRDRNHPSVVMWGIGNEIMADPVVRGLEMSAAVRAIDDTRPVLRGGFYDPLAWEYTDLGDEHYKTPNDLTVARTQHPDKLIVQSESYPGTIYTDWEFEQANAWAIGNFVWTAWDHIGETGVGAPVIDPGARGQNAVGLAGGFPYPFYLSYAGDLDVIGQRKPQNYWRQAIYGMSPVEILVERPLPGGIRQGTSGWAYYDELPSWTWSVAVGTSMRVRVYTAGDSAELLLNGVSLGRKALTVADQMRTFFDVPYAAGELVAVARKGDTEIGRKTLVTVGAPAAVRLTSDVNSLTTSRDDLAHVLVEIVDAQGRLVPDAVTKVSFDVSGAGTLMGVANANPHNVDSFQKPRRHTYHGKALAILRPAKTAGTLTLRATAEGLSAATLNLPVSAAPSR